MLRPAVLMRLATSGGLLLTIGTAGGWPESRAGDPAPTAAVTSSTAVDAAAYVNGVPVSRSALEAALQAAVRDLPLTMRDRQALRAVILDDLINDKLLEQFLNQEKISVEYAEIEAQKKDLLQRLQRERRTLAEYCRQIGVTEEQLQSLWSLQSRWRRYVQREANDERLRAFYEQHRERFERSTARASHILLRCDPHASAEERRRLRSRLEGLRQQILDGRLDFAVAARRYSHCPSGAVGGDLGTLTRHMLSEEEPWLQHVFTLPVGELSPVIESPIGFHLFYVRERTHRPAPPLEECLVEVLEAFAEDLRQQTLQRLRRTAQISIPADKAP